MSKNLFVAIAFTGVSFIPSFLTLPSATFAACATTVANDNYNDDSGEPLSRIINMSPEGDVSIIRVQTPSDIPPLPLPVFVPPTSGCSFK